MNPIPLTESLWPDTASDELPVATLADAARSAAAADPSAVALVDGIPDPAARRRWTYGELVLEMETVATALLETLTPGDRVMVCSPNCPESSILQFALSAAGLVLVPVNPGYRTPEILHIAVTTGARALIVASEYRGSDLLAIAAEVAASSTVEHVLRLDDWAIWSRPTVPKELAPVDPRDVGLVIFTSGTTGKSKGAMLRHTGMVDTAIETLRHAGVDTSANFVWVNAMPLYNMAGAGSPTHATAWFGGTHVIMREFDPHLLLDLIETEGGTITLAVPTMLTAALDSLAARPRALPSLRTVITGASTVPQPLVDEVRHALGVDVLISYGLTEAHGSVCGTRVSDSSRDAAETIGTPNDHIEVAIVDLESGDVVPVGGTGEIRMRGHQVMVGYVGNDEATRTAVDADGWLRTGDIGSMDERGYVRIVGRAKDLIIRGGANIYPREVEDRLAEHVSVRDVAVIGIPHPTWGEEVAAVVRLAQGAAPSKELAASLALHCDAAVARYKVPRHWYFVDELPLTASGKILKPELREQIAAGRAGIAYSTASIERLSSAG